MMLAGARDSAGSVWAGGGLQGPAGRRCSSRVLKKSPTGIDFGLDFDVLHRHPIQAFIEIKARLGHTRKPWTKSVARASTEA